MLDFYQDGQKTRSLSFPGEPEIGETVETKITIKNPHPFPVRLQLSEITDPRLEMESLPDGLNAGQAITIKALFTPSEEILSPFSYPLEIRVIVPPEE